MFWKRRTRENSTEKIKFKHFNFNATCVLINLCTYRCRGAEAQNLMKIRTDNNIPFCKWHFWHFHFAFKKAVWSK